MRVFTRPASLGILGESAEEFAQAEFVRSWTRLQAETDYLANARPSNWEERATQTGKVASNELKFLKSAVLGKTGNPEGEDRLFSAWGDILAKTIEMERNAPSIWAQIKDKTSLFFTDFWQGVRQAQKSFSEWIVTNAGSTLLKYHEAVNKAIVLENDLNSLKRTGQISASAASTRQAELEKSKAQLDTIRSTYSRVSGGASIDELAQREFGAYQALAAAPVVIAVAAGVAVIAIAALVWKAWSFIDSLKPLTVEAQNAVAEIREAVKKGEAAIATGQTTLAKAGAALVRGESTAGAIEEFVRGVLPWAVGGIAVAVILYLLLIKKR